VTQVGAVSAGIGLHDVTLCYRLHPAVHHLSGRFEAGSLTAVIGPNGAGKSTLLAGLMGHMNPSTGHIDLPSPLQGRLAYLPQQAEVDRSFPVRVLDVVMLGHWASLGAWRGARRDQAPPRWTRCRRSAWGASPKGASASCRRAVSACAVRACAVAGRRVILLDEPFNAIDARTTADLLALLHRWHAEGRTVVAVLHDLDQVRRTFRRPCCWRASPSPGAPRPRCCAAAPAQAPGRWPSPGTTRRPGAIRTPRRLAGAPRDGLRPPALQPFVEFAFMRRALVACLALGLSCGPGHAAGAAPHEPGGRRHGPCPAARRGGGLHAGGLSLPAMSLGAFMAALAVAALAGGVTRWTAQREDASFAAFYLIALALGVMLISLRGNSVDLMRVLFGSVLAVDDAALLLVAGVSSATLLALAMVYRPLLVESFDPGFLRSVGGPGALAP
jgi:zinc/manganese transport system ATP-binding protein